jgi:ribonucleoside-diphosphate reductase alpha subunit
MQVVKRDGRSQAVSLDKVLARVRELSRNLRVDPVLVAQKVVGSIVDGILTSELDGVAARVAAALAVLHPDYGQLAGRVECSNLRKNTRHLSFSDALLRADRALHPEMRAALGSPGLDEVERSALFDPCYRGFMTLRKSYLLTGGGEVVERPEALFLRLALFLWPMDALQRDRVFRALVGGLFIHATPTLFHAGLEHGQLSSCFLMTVREDSISGIFDTLKDCALISKAAGGIGLDVTPIRARGSAVNGVDGVCTGIVPALRIFNNAARWVDQGAKRKGAWAMYLEPWHADVLEFLELRLNQGAETSRARDLFYGLWVPDLFMRRVREDASWSLFCPSTAPDLHGLYGEAFERRFLELEGLGLARRTLPAREVWTRVLQSQVETGLPYMAFKDTANRLNPQMNLGALSCSNLCTEILLYVAPDEVAVCNLASVCVSRFVADGVVDYDGIAAMAGLAVRNLNRVIDATHYPLEAARRSNLRHRPVGVGVQGLADLFQTLGLAYTSPEAREVNVRVFESLYWGALEASSELAARDGSYESFDGSPASRGLLQMDLRREAGFAVPKLSRDWAAMRERCSRGLRNSCLIAPMPTVSTSNILGNSEGIEPSANLTLNKTLTGEYAVLNKRLVAELEAAGQWSPQIADALMASGGSLADVDCSPRLRDVFASIWDMSLRTQMDMNAERAAFVDQSVSFNLHVADPSKLTSALFYAWTSGLKTTYYVRTRPAATPLNLAGSVAACESCSA